MTLRLPAATDTAISYASRRQDAADTLSIYYAAARASLRHFAAIVLIIAARADCAITKPPSLITPAGEPPRPPRYAAY
jgi:hypothetical protein